MADVSAGSIATAQADSERFIEDCLKRAGIRLVRITATTPPLPDAVRALVIEARTDRWPSREARLSVELNAG